MGSNAIKDPRRIRRSTRSSRSFQAVAVWAPYGDAQLEDFRRFADRYRRLGLVSFGAPRSELSALWCPAIGWNIATSAPAIDLVERRDAYELRAELPGVEARDIEVKVAGDRLTVHGKVSNVYEGEAATLFGSDPSVGQFERSLSLPDPVDGSNIKTTLNETVLTILVPKQV